MTGNALTTTRQDTGADGNTALVGDRAGAGFVAVDQPDPVLDTDAALQIMSRLGILGEKIARDLRQRGRGGALELAEHRRTEFLSAIGASAGDFVAAFEVLSPNVKAAIYGMLADARRPNERASAEDVATFRATSHGAILAGQWGSAISGKLGLAIFKCDAMEANLTAAEQAEFRTFWNGMQPNERAVVLDVVTR